MRDVTRRCVQAVCALAIGSFLFGASAAGAADPGPVIGRAVSVHGTVFAETPGQPKRTLECRDPIFDGDRVTTAEKSAVGIDSGSFYVRLGESSDVGMSALASGAPHVDLANGHVRLMNSADETSAAAEVTTPGLRVARTGSDQDALVFGEKATAVSMVCAYEEGLDVARRSNPAEQLAAAPGSCVVGKPREPLYIAPATHPMLAVLAEDACSELAMLPVAGRFTPTTVALAPPAAVFGGPPGPDLFPIDAPNLPCSPACPQAPPPPPGPPGLPTQFPFVPPVLPPVVP
jgi:hypothetical protein